MRVVDNFCGKLKNCGKVALFQRFLIVERLTDQIRFVNQTVYIIMDEIMELYHEKRKNYGK